MIRLYAPTPMNAGALTTEDTTKGLSYFACFFTGMLAGVLLFGGNVRRVLR